MHFKVSYAICSNLDQSKILSFGNGFDLNHRTCSVTCPLLNRRLDFYQMTILAMSNLQVFSDNKFDMLQMVQSFFDRVENIVGKGENAGYHHFLFFFQQSFQKACFQGALKGGIYTRFDASTADSF